MCVFLKRVCNAAFLDYCLSTGFTLNLFLFLNGVTSFICGVLPCGLLFKEALNTWNVLLFLACLADSGKAFSSLIVINSMSKTVNTTNMWCFWVAVSHNKILYVLDEMSPLKISLLQYKRFWQRWKSPAGICLCRLPEVAPAKCVRLVCYQSNTLLAGTEVSIFQQILKCPTVIIGGIHHMDGSLPFSLVQYYEGQGL